MIADVEDFVGSGEVSGRDLGDVRRLLDSADADRGAQGRSRDRALRGNRRASRRRHRASALNLLGVLHLWRNRLKEAETAFLQALSEPDFDEDSRVARASALCNLGYAQQLAGDLEKAVKSARRSQALCEEIGIDPFHALFARFYFDLLRTRRRPRRRPRRARAAARARRRRAAPLQDRSLLENNKPILDAFRRSPLAARASGPARIVPLSQPGSAAEHLTDVACLEWVRHRRIALAPETTSGVEIHLAACPACRDKVAAFDALERSFHPYGSPMPLPRALRLGRALKVVVLVLAGVGVVVAVVAVM